MDDYEVAFADMAYSRLQDEGTELLPYNIGFEIVDKNQEGTHAVGIFVFKINNLTAYAPAFYINGEVKPMVLLFLPEQNLFQPLTEENIRHLLKQSTLQLGASGEKRDLDSFAQPSLENLITPPRTGRYVAASAKDMLKVACYDRTLTEDILVKYAEQSPVNILNFFINNKDMIKYASKFKFLDALMEACKNIKVASTITETKGKVIEEKDQGFVEEARKLPTREKAKVIREGFLVKEDGDTSTRLYNIQYPSKFQNPNKTGIYLTILEDGTVAPCAVLMFPRSLDGKHSLKAALVIDLDTRNYCLAPANKVWITDNYEVDDVSSFVNTGTDTLTIGKRYFLMAPSAFKYKAGKCTETFVVKGKVQTDSLSYVLASPKQCLPWDRRSENSEADKSNSEYFGAQRRGEPSEALYRTTNECGDIRPTCKLFMSSSISDNLENVGTGLSVPRNYSFYELNGPLSLGDTGTLRFMLKTYKGFNTLKVRNDGAEYFLKLEDAPWKRFSKKANVAKHLDERGFNKADILDILKGGEFLVKNAYSPPIMTDSNYSAMTQYPFEQTYPATAQAPLTGPQPLGMGENLYTGPSPGFNEAAALGDQLAQLGDKDLFEHGILGALATNSDIVSSVSAIIPELKKALDKLGRLIFLFWYKASEFQKMYQVTEYNKYEDLLTRTFKDMGDIVLKLQKKVTIDSIGDINA